MTVKWDNGAYFGTRQKRYYKFLDSLLMKLLKQAKDEGVNVSNETLDRIIVLTGRQNTLVNSITKLVENLSINQKVDDIERIIMKVPAGALSEAMKDDSVWGKRLKESVEDWR